jgi:RHS repeat-associated protein
VQPTRDPEAPDWYELFVSGTSPRSHDTDGDGIWDASDSAPLDAGTNADGRTNATYSWSENLTAPSWTGTSAVDGKSIYMHSGEFTHSLELLRIDPGYGPSMDLTISYRSGITYDSATGRNWSWLAAVKEQANHDLWYFPGDGTKRVYAYHPPAGGDPEYWTAPGDGVYFSLAKNGDGTYTGKSTHGGEKDFDTSGNITAVKDRFGNTVTYAYTSGKLSTITDATGHVVTVAWYGTGRVQTLTDSDNRVVTLTYNYYGQLAKVTTPTSSQYPSGRTFQFAYSSGVQTGTLNNNLVQAIDPKGQHWLQNEFDENDRIVKQYLGDDYFTFSYDMTNHITTAYDREGNQRDWAWSGVVPTSLTEYSNRNVRGNDSGNDDPTSWVTSFSHDSTTKLRTEVVYPRGNSAKTAYDSAGNVTEIRRKTDHSNADNNTNDNYESFQYDSNHNLATSHTDARGNTTSYTLESTGSLTNKVVVTVTHPTVTYLNPTQTVSEALTWNSYGQLVTVTDGESKERKNIYFADESETGVKKGYLKKHVVDSATGGLALTTEYGRNNWGTVTSVTNPRGKTTAYTVNEYDWVTHSETGSPQGYEIVVSYDANGNVQYRDVENVDKTNTRDTGNPWFRTSFTYDLLEQVATKTEEIDATHTRTWNYDYTKNGKLKILTKPEANLVRYYYDERDLVYEEVRGYNTSDASTAKSYYDENRNLKKWTNGRSKSWTCTYDLFDRRTQVTNPITNYTTYAYDMDSNLTEVQRYEEAGTTDVLLEDTKQDFDEMSRMYEVERGLKGTSSWSWLDTTLTFDKRSLVTLVHDPRSKNTTIGYDAAGRRTSVVDALGNEVDLTLDANGNVTHVNEVESTGFSSATTFATERDYDEVDRLKEERVVNQTSSTDKHLTDFKYDSLSVLVERIDAESNSTTWTHDGLARVLTESIDLGSGNSKTRTWAFDKNDRMTSHKDDANNETTWSWNARDLASAETYPDTYAKTFGYDAADNLNQWIDPNGTQVDLTYDDNNRDTARTITRGTGVVGTTSESYAYDALDRMTEAQDDDVTLDLTFDSLSRKLTEVSGLNPMSTSGKTTSTTYDGASNVTQVAYPDGSFVVNRTVDDVNRPTAFTDGSSASIVSVDYYGPGGRLKKLTFGNTSTAAYGYNGFRWISDLDHKDSSTTLLRGYDSAYDKIGNLVYEEWGHDSGKGHNFYYDKAYRLTKTLQHCADPSAEYATPGSQTYDTKLEYNLSDDSDRSSVVSTPYNQSSTTTNYTSNSTHAYTDIGGTSRTYDHNGNLTDDGTFTYAYDYRNQLVTATRKSNSHTEGTYEYDALGRRTKKTLYSGSSVRYYHDGVHEIEEYDGSGNLLRKYVHRQDIDSITMMEAKDVADVDNDSNTTELIRLYYHYDARGNVACLTAAAQTVVESYEYDPYGNLTSIRDKNGSTVSATQVGNPFDFQGRRRDYETGLMYFRTRMYDSSGGHWLQRDSVGLDPSANWHEFESSDPAGNSDPMGTQDSGGRRLFGDDDFGVDLRWHPPRPEPPPPPPPPKWPDFSFDLHRITLPPPPPPPPPPRWPDFTFDLHRITLGPEPPPPPPPPPPRPRFPLPFSTTFVPPRDFKWPPPPPPQPPRWITDAVNLWEKWGRPKVKVHRDPRTGAVTVEVEFTIYF